MNAYERLGLYPGQFPWYHFIARSGDAGQRFVLQFNEHNGGEMTTLVDQGLDSLRHRRREEGRALLRQSVEFLDARRGVAPPSVVHVLERWSHSALAYESYLDQDFDAAEHHFEIAEQAICNAIEELPCLIMIANHCYDFRLQRARIARNRLHWRVMKNHIEVGRTMVENQRPLCVLGNGEKIFIKAVDHFHGAIQPRDEEERVALAGILNTERRQELFEHTVKDSYALPGIVIPYRPAQRPN